MARTYTLIDAAPSSLNPLNIAPVVQVTDSETGEVLTLKDSLTGFNITAEVLREKLGEIEANVIAPRAAALAELRALKGQTLTPKLPVAPDPKRVAYELAAQKLVNLTTLVNLKVIEDTDKEYTDALAAVKAAKADVEADAIARKP